jgi:hypothetical protein
MPTSFAKPINNITTTVAAPYTAGSGSLKVASAAGITLGGSQWIRVSTFRSGAPLSILKATAVSGNVLTIAGAADGYTDVNLISGDAAELRVTAGALAELHTAVNALETRIAGSTVTGNIPGNAASITGSITESQVTNLTKDLAAKAADAAVVHLAGTETIGGSKTFTAPQSLTVASGQVGLSVTAVDHSAIDITKTGGSGEFMMRFNTLGAPAGWNPQTYFNGSGALFTNAWLTISGHPTGSGDGYRIMGVKGTPAAPLGPDPSMISVWSDVNGPAIQVQGSNGKSVGSYLFGGVDTTGHYTFTIEEDGQLWWGSTVAKQSNGHPSLDTNLYRSAAGTLKTDNQFVSAGGLVTCSGAGGSIVLITSTSYMTEVIKTTGTSKQLILQPDNGQMVMLGCNSVPNFAKAALYIRPQPGATVLDHFAIENSAGTACLYRIDKSGHHVTGGTAPSITAGTGVGTSPTVSVSGTDTNGVITVTTGASPAAGATVASLNFAAAFTAAPKSVHLMAANGSTAALSGAGAVWADAGNLSANGFTLSVGAAALAASTTYKWYYHVLG